MTVLGLPVACLDKDRAREEVSRLLADRTASTLVYLNAHAVNVAQHDAEYRQVIKDADLVLNDGSGLALAARLQGRRFPANLNGTDFNPEVLRLAADYGLSVYLLGGPPGVAEQAARELARRIPALRIAGHHHGFMPASEEQAVAESIARTGADVLVVAMGNPAQELFLKRHLAETGVRLGVGVGAFLEFVIHRFPRAPGWMRRIGLEWVYRLAQEPGRMWRRYLVGNVVFLGRVLADRFAPARLTQHWIQHG